MKNFKVLVLMLIVLSCLNFGLSACDIWSTSGSDTYYNSGNIGIGTSSPNVELQIVDTSGNAFFKLDAYEDAAITLNSGSGYDAGIVFKEDDVYKWSILNDGDDSLKIHKYISTEEDVLIIDSTGDVFITETLSVDEGIKRGESGVVLKEKVIDIGDWNMYAGGGGQAQLAVAHGLALAAAKKIRNVFVMIRDDNDNVPIPLNSVSSAAVLQGGVETISSTNVTLRRLTGGDFDGAGYDSTTYNRGFIYILYEI